MPTTSSWSNLYKSTKLCVLHWTPKSYEVAINFVQYWWRVQELRRSVPWQFYLWGTKEKDFWIRMKNNKAEGYFETSNLRHAYNKFLKWLLYKSTKNMSCTGHRKLWVNHKFCTVLVECAGLTWKFALTILPLRNLRGKKEKWFWIKW